jgi:LDH2 family malate/lactate/ureidoglycolate dehydrogenase
MPATVTIAPQDLRRLAVAALTAAGAAQQHADWTADILIEGDNPQWIDLWNGLSR